MRANWPSLQAALTATGQGSRNSLAGVIATVAIETASTFAPVREAFWLDENWRRANLRYYPYYGRGYIQLTWDYNYRAAGQAMGVDLLNNPDLAMDPAYAARTLAWYWQGRDIQSIADRRDWTGVRKAVQGGTDGLDRLVQIAGALLG